MLEFFIQQLINVTDNGMPYAYDGFSPDDLHEWLENNPQNIPALIELT